MEDPHALFNVYANPTLDELFGTSGPPPNQSSAPPDFPGAGDDDQDRVSDFDLSGDYHDVWLSLSEAGPSGTRDDHDDSRGESLVAGNIVADNNRNTLRPLQVWPAPPPPINCSFCQVLRAIVHVHYAYNNYMKLEIHGGLGVIIHAVLEKRIANVFAGDSQFEMIDFCNRSIEEVKQFLTLYCLQRSQEGYIMSNDPLSLFYEALCVGLPSRPQILHNNLPENNITGGGYNHQNLVQQQPPPPPPPQQQQDGQEQENQPENRQRREGNVRIPLSEQRKRTARLTLKDMSVFFHFALADAAKRLEVCSTVLKKICRRDGIPRWPYRKVDSVKKKIKALQRNLNSSHAAVRADAEEKINKLRQEAASACGGLNVL